MDNSYIGKTCPYCQFPLKADSEVVVCAECRISHHRECWQENGGCTTFGHQGLREEAGADPAVKGLLDITLGDPVGRQTRQPISEKTGRLLVSIVLCFLVLLTTLLFVVFRISYSDRLISNGQSAPAEDPIESSAEIDITAVPDGIYQGSAPALAGMITVAVQVEGGRIVSIEVLEHGETPIYFIESYPLIPEKIIAEQSFDVDTKTGATESAQGIVDAVRSALTAALEDNSGGR